ncbi:MAG: hypothetical protein AAGF54_15630, partial [Pseudomonadota bacterium]
MQILQLQGLFAPLVAMLAGTALLVLWHINRRVRYLPYFGLSLYCTALAIFFSQFLFERMTVPNALSNSIFFFAASGFMV